MLEEETINYLRFEGARTLLSVFRRRVPDPVGERAAGLEPALRSLWLAGERGGRNLYEVAAQVRLMADVLEPGVVGSAVVPDDLREMTTGWDTAEPWTVLRASHCAGSSKLNTVWDQAPWTGPTGSRSSSRTSPPTCAKSTHRTGSPGSRSRAFCRLFRRPSCRLASAQAWSG
jgi:hypothetical protein